MNSTLIDLYYFLGLLGLWPQTKTEQEFNLSSTLASRMFSDNMDISLFDPFFCSDVSVSPFPVSSSSFLEAAKIFF